MRRPSPALVVALIALFVALGGPATAASLIRGSQIKKNSITSKQIKNHTLATKDLSRRAFRSLRITPNGSVTEAKLANGAVSSAKLGGAAVTGAKMASGAVGPIQVADHSLTATDVARFAGRFTVTVTALAPGQCWEGQPLNQAPQGTDIRNDIVTVTPANGWPNPSGLQVRASISDGAHGHFSINICNNATVNSARVPKATFPGGNITFNYMVTAQ
jgi:hypothetical protein